MVTAPVAKRPQAAGPARRRRAAGTVCTPAHWQRLVNGAWCLSVESRYLLCTLEIGSRSSASVPELRTRVLAIGVHTTVRAYGFLSVLPDIVLLLPFLIHNSSSRLH